MTARRTLLAAALVVAVPPAAAQGGDVQADAPDPNRGRLVAIGGWTQGEWPACVQCHGLDGTGDGSGAFPRLAGLDGWTIYKALRDYAAGLRPSDVMSPIARALDDRQMQDVAAHFAAFADVPYPEPARAPPPDLLQAGGAIVAVGIPEKGVPACSSCHGENGVGGSVVFPRIGGQYAPYLELQLLEWREGRRDGDPMNVMERIAKALSDEEIRAVSAYLAAVDPLAMEPPPVTPPPLPAASAAPEPPWLPAGTGEP